MKNARFWHIGPDGSPVKLTIHPGEMLEWCKFYRHEEGWTRQVTCWDYDAARGVIVRAEEIDGMDCDGRHSSYATTYCPVGHLRGHRNQIDSEHYHGTRWPDWRLEKEDQRDYAAEAAGY
jgi:hypothetical protein